MSIYYSDEAVTLYHGDSLEILPTLDVKAEVLLTDPPYFKVKQEEWDNQWDKAHEFLGWMGDFLDRAKPLLTSQASVWVFASPAMTSSVERLVGERFRVLNSIRWVKEAGWHQKAELTSLRSYLTAWEGVIFAEQLPNADLYPTRDQELHRKVFASVGAYIQTARESANLTRQEVAAALTGYKTLDSAAANVANWELGKNLVSERDYEAMTSVLGNALTLTYPALCALWDACQQEYAAQRRQFTVDRREHSTDVWNFAPVIPFPGKHPCEKPESMLRHMITASSRAGDLILDPFAGSGATLIAASNAGRRAVGIEKDERWCEHAAKRLSQGTLELEWTA